MPRKTVFRALHQFVEENDVDTDYIEEDLDIYREDETSNLYEHFQDAEAINHILSIWHHQQIMGKSFETGFQFLYWKWYRTATEQDLKGNKWLSMMGVSGRSGQEMSVYPRHQNLKDEILATGLVTPEMWEDYVVKKATRYLKSDKCKEIRSIPLGGLYGDDPFHFEIEEGAPLSPRHIQAIILYCDFTEICREFSESLRKCQWDETFEDVKDRNGSFYHFSKSLRELTTYFGTDGSGFMNSTDGAGVKGPFYCGVSVVLNISEFSIGFNTPTSTSKTREIAWNFAGGYGMVLKLGNEVGNSEYEALFNATWISSFVEEDEYFWFGSVERLQLQDIIMVETNKSHSKTTGALFLFDAVLSGHEMRNIEVSDRGIRILKYLLEITLGTTELKRPKQVS